jgi:O-antigen ligase
MRNIVFLLLMVMVFQIPWEPLVILGAFGTLIHAIGLAAAGLGVIALVTSGRIRSLPLLLWLMVIFVGFASLSIFWSQATFSPMSKIVTTVELLAFAWLIWEFTPDVVRLKLLMHSYVWGAGLAIVVQILGMRGYVAMLHEEERYGAGQMNVNELGIVLLMAIPMAVYFVPDRQFNRLLRLAYLVFVPVCGVAILLTGSRMAFLTLCVMAAMIAFLYMLKRPVFVIFFSIVAGSAFMFLFARIMPESTWDRLSKTSYEITSGNWGGRLEIWDAALQLHNEYPVLGTGYGSFSDVIGRASGTKGAGMSAHNTFLSVLVELGYVGTGLIILMGTVAVVYAVKMPFRERVTWLTILLCWITCALAGHLEANKITWFVLPMVACQYVICRQQRAGRVQVQPQGLVDPQRPLLMRSRWGNKGI